MSTDKPNSKKFLVGVDVGTQGVKAAIYDLDGKLAGNGFCPSTLIQPKPGITEEDPETQYQNSCKAISIALRQSGVDPSQILAVSLDGQMAGILGVDEKGRAVTPYDSWLDTRCAPYIDEMRRQAQQKITALTGNAPSFNHGPRILWWKHEKPEVYAKIARFVQPSGYVALRMMEGGAEQAFIDTTYLHFSGFADNVNEVWSDELLNLFGIEAERMPRIVAPTEIVGHTSAQAERDCGLKEGTAIVAGCGDTAASFLAAGATEAGICVDVSGTASVYAATTASMRPDHIDGMLGVGRSTIPGLWHPYAYINGGGMNLEWYRSFASEIRGSEVTFPELEDLATKVDPSNGSPLFIPHMAGRNSPSEPNFKGAWLGLDWTHSTGALYRAILESVALEYRMYQERLTALNPDDEVKELRNTGGGNSSALWKQIKADALETPVVEIPDFAGAALGSAMVAGVGVGALPSLQEAARIWVKPGAQTTPQSGLFEHYKSRMDQYSSSLEAARLLANRSSNGE